MVDRVDMVQKEQTVTVVLHLPNDITQNGHIVGRNPVLLVGETNMLQHWHLLLKPRLIKRRSQER